MHKKKNNKPLVSVIIPAYNEERNLGKCLASLNTQRFSNFEVLVINDGSTDLTKQIARDYGVKVFSLSHGGPGRAKNYGAKQALGKILVFIDADLCLDKDYLRNITQPIIKNKCDGVFTTKEYVVNFDNIWARCWSINMGLTSKLRIKENVDDYRMAFRAILKKKFLNNKGFNPRWGYTDDKSLFKSKIYTQAVDDAVCYHFNPDTLKDVFLSARWIGRSKDFTSSFSNLIRYSALNSIVISVRKILEGIPVKFIIFKIIFDLGIIVGILFKNSKHNFAK